MIYKYDEKLAYDYENGFNLTSDIKRLSNIVSHWEIYKKIVELPGEIVELGVFKGGSFLRLASYRNMLENEWSRKIIGFDVFDEFPRTQNKGDQIFREEWVEETNNEFATEKDIQDALDWKGIKNTELVKGDIALTIPKYLEKHPYLRIALLHIDTDIYEPAKIGLDYLYERIVPGGIILLDDYGVAGETDAVDEFLKDKDLMLQKFSFSQLKPTYIVKKRLEEK